MKHLVTIRTDSISITEGRVIETRSSLEALLAAFHHETVVYKHLKDMPHARLHIEVGPVEFPKEPLTFTEEVVGKQ